MATEVPVPIPSRLPAEFVRKAHELRGKAVREGVEYGASICYDPRSREMRLSGECRGNECNVEVLKGCPPGHVYVGSFHVHSRENSSYFSTLDVASKLEDYLFEGQLFNCLMTKDHDYIVCHVPEPRADEEEVRRVIRSMVDDPRDYARWPRGWFRTFIYSPRGEAVEPGTPEFEEAVERISRGIVRLAVRKWLEDEEEEWRGAPGDRFAEYAHRFLLSMRRLPGSPEELLGFIGEETFADMALDVLGFAFGEFCPILASETDREAFEFCTQAALGVVREELPEAVRRVLERTIKPAIRRQFGRVEGGASS